MRWVFVTDRHSGVGPTRGAPAALRVRTATAEDVAPLADLAERSFVAAFGSDNDPDDVRRYVADAFSRDRIAAELTAAGSWFLLAHEHDDPGGPAVGYARLLFGGHDLVGGHRPIQLVRLYVAPERIGRGGGGALMAACLDQAARLGCDRMWLGVWEHNTRAQRFYRHWGFRRVGDERFVLGSDLQTDHVMARPVAA